MRKNNIFKRFLRNVRGKILMNINNSYDLQVNTHSLFFRSRSLEIIIKMYKIDHRIYTQALMLSVSITLNIDEIQYPVLYNLLFNVLYR